jgi:hypothetical protein
MVGTTVGMAAGIGTGVTAGGTAVTAFAGGSRSGFIAPRRSFSARRFYFSVASGRSASFVAASEPLCLRSRMGCRGGRFGPETASASAEQSEVILLNRTDRPAPMPGEAEVRFLDGDFRVMRPGAFVRCAVTGTPIPLEELRYWSVDLQEAYATPEAVLQRVGSDYPRKA